MYTVYKHITPDGKVYVGMTSKFLDERWKNGHGYSGNRFRSAINQYGWKNIRHEVIAVYSSADEAWEEEKRQIKLCRSNEPEYGFNISLGGKYPSYGMKHTEEWKQNHGCLLRGKKRPPSVGQKISARKKGHSNGREGQFGEKSPISGIVNQIDESSGKIIASFYGFDEMHRITGFAKTPVREATSGVRKRAYGYIWKYEKRGKQDVFF